MKKKHVVIVGAGLFGSIAAKLCLRAGHRVTVIDDNRPFSGSKPAACLMKPGWMSGLGEKADIGLQVLGMLYDVHEIPFHTRAGNVNVFWVDPAKVLDHGAETIRGTVTDINPDGSVVYIPHNKVPGADPQNVQITYGDAVLVAAGVWCKQLVEGLPEIRALVGSALLFKGETKQPRITVWAPYKQAVSFMRERGHTWFGDGTSIIEKNWRKQETRRIEETIQRAKGHKLFKKDLVKVLVGMRPYCPAAKGGLFMRIKQDPIWVSTGGAKNGTVLAAYQAHKFVEAIK